jgi:hypothetical protein
LIQPRVKVRLHPGRMAYTTLLAKAGSGVNPEWRECFVLPPPTSPESSPCVSFRSGVAGQLTIEVLSIGARCASVSQDCARLAECHRGLGWHGRYCVAGLLALHSWLQWSLHACTIDPRRRLVVHQAHRLCSAAHWRAS